MSLLVWLPLQGDLRNNGLAGDLTFGAVTASYDNAGKIGKALSVRDANIRFIVPELENLKTFSVAFWYKPIANESLTTNWCDILAFTCKQADGSTSGNWRFESSYGNTYQVSHHNNVGDAISTHSSLVSGWGEWHHICVVVNESTEKSVAYVDATVKNTVAHRGGYLTGTVTIAGEGTDPYGLMNDLRIYDHALSDREVKELAKGLVAHWKLDENISVLNNAYSYPTFDTSVATGGWSHWGYSGNQGSYAQNTDKQYIYNKSQSYSHMISNGASASAGAHYLVYQSPAFEGGYRSLQCICKEVNGARINESIFYPSWNARDGGVANNKWTSITPLGDGFYLCKCEGIHQNGSNDLIGFYVTVGNTVYISEAYCENDREVCSDIFWQDEIGTIHDSSGYCHDGILSPTPPTFDSDSARYSGSTRFDGVNNYIEIQDLECMPAILEKAWTVSFWVWNNDDGNRSIIFSNFSLGGVSGTSFGIEKATNNNIRIAYVNGTFDKTIASIMDVQMWAHFAVTKTEDHLVTVYKNGVQVGQYTNENCHSSGTIYRIGSDSRSDNTRFNGKLSDIRIYATALSADDIKELYATSASIDDHHNVYARELVEG